MKDPNLENLEEIEKMTKLRTDGAKILGKTCYNCYTLSY